MPLRVTYLAFQAIAASLSRTSLNHALSHRYCQWISYGSSIKKFPVKFCCGIKVVWINFAEPTFLEICNFFNMKCGNNIWHRNQRNLKCLAVLKKLLLHTAGFGSEDIVSFASRNSNFNSQKKKIPIGFDSRNIFKFELWETRKTPNYFPESEWTIILIYIIHNIYLSNVRQTVSLLIERGKKLKVFLLRTAEMKSLFIMLKIKISNF